MHIQEGTRRWNVLHRFSNPGWPRRALFNLGLLLALTVIIRVLLDPIVAHLTHKQLNASEAVSGDFESVHVTLLPPGHGIRRLKIIEAQGGDWRHPLFYAEHARVTLDWRRLLHAELVARLRLDGPKMARELARKHGAVNLCVRCDPRRPAMRPSNSAGTIGVRYAVLYSTGGSSNLIAMARHSDGRSRP